MLDKDGDGYIDNNELKLGFGSCNLNDQQMDQVQTDFIARFDKDKDGRVSFEEFVDAMTTNVKETIQDKMTEDADGYLSIPGL